MCFSTSKPGYSSSQAYKTHPVGWVERSETQRYQAIVLGFGSQPNLRIVTISDEERL